MASIAPILPEVAPSLAALRRKDETMGKGNNSQKNDKKNKKVKKDKKVESKSASKN